MTIQSIYNQQLTSVASLETNVHTLRSQRLEDQGQVSVKRQGCLASAAGSKTNQNGEHRMSRKAYFTIFVVVILALAWCIPSLGQVIKGSISGTVVDQQSAVV